MGIAPGVLTLPHVLFGERAIVASGVCACELSPKKNLTVVPDRAANSHSASVEGGIFLPPGDVDTR